MTLVDSITCTKIKTQEPFILVLKMGENLHEAILECADKLNLKSAFLSGIGKLDDITVAFFNRATKQYDSKLFNRSFELISLNGNISFANQERFLHVHAAMGDENYDVIGGHIMDAKVGETAEIAITPLSEKIMREYDANIGLKVMCPITTNRLHK